MVFICRLGRNGRSPATGCQDEFLNAKAKKIENNVYIKRLLFLIDKRIIFEKYKIGIKIKKYYLLKYGLLNLGPFFIIS